MNLNDKRKPGITCPVKDADQGVSYEIGASYMPVQTRLCGLNGSQMQVLAWLRANKATIIRFARKFRVDRRAIAGAIAFEMLENIHTAPVTVPGIPSIDVGPAKVHVWVGSQKHIGSSIIFMEWNRVFSDIGNGTWAKDVEDRKYLSSQSPESRQVLLSTNEGAITYIAAIMADIADLCEENKLRSIRYDPIILTNVYHGKLPKEWEDYVKSLPTSHHFKGGNPMDKWIAAHMDFIEDGVGRQEIHDLK
jgi:hypothetical protein